MQAAVAEAGEHTRRHVQESYERAGSGDPGGDGFGAGPTEDAAQPTLTLWTLWNHTRHFPIYPDRHRIP
ncbi:hypothetical protein GCM10018785_03940 [Streptomyces longispororuber]|uniref:Uncharacterized protein n=1 Tax=Streptomyces longispororuber TaxID=68230 RepID=A0A918Z4Z9_9ACTN|nr:hypothetical protein GCM10018785_03940 [Streptomyces longispororuber]